MVQGPLETDSRTSGGRINTTQNMDHEKRGFMP